MKKTFILLFLCPAAWGADRLPQAPSASRLPQAPAVKATGCPCLVGGPCTCSSVFAEPCACGAGCTCANCPGGETYPQARARAVKTHSNIVVWIGDWNRNTSRSVAEALGPGWVTAYSRSLSGDSRTRVVVGGYHDGELYGAVECQPTVSAIKDALSWVVYPQNGPPQPWVLPSYRAPAVEYQQWGYPVQPSFGGGFYRGGGGGRRGGGSC